MEGSSQLFNLPRVEKECKETTGRSGVEGQKDREEHPGHRMGYLPNDWGKGKEENQEQPRQKLTILQSTLKI